MTRIPTFWVVYGTRPEVIKMAPVARALAQRAAECRVLRVFTGQHRELARDLFDTLSMSPDLDFDLMTANQSVEAMGAACLLSVARALSQERPDCLLVQGDTTTVLFASLAAFLHKLPIGHVEAGLRSGMKYAPFPEEMARRLTDVLTDYHFAPTERAARNLLAEGTPREHIHVTGNTSIDAVRWLADEAEGRASPWVREWASQPRPYILVTLHRRESFGHDLNEIVTALAEFASGNPAVRVICPLHPNPNAREAVIGALSSFENVTLCEPLRYLDMLHLLSRSTTVVTDSGGIQEEGPAVGKRVLVARRVTERPEGVEAGTSILVGADRDRIRSALSAELARADGRPELSGESHETPYGDGGAGARIADILISHYRRRDRLTTDWRPCPPG